MKTPYDPVQKNIMAMLYTQAKNVMHTDRGILAQFDETTYARYQIRDDQTDVIEILQHHPNSIHQLQYETSIVIQKKTQLLHTHVEYRQYHLTPLLDTLEAQIQEILEQST